MGYYFDVTKNIPVKHSKAAYGVTQRETIRRFWFTDFDKCELYRKMMLNSIAVNSESTQWVGGTHCTG